jgi:methyl-accepting chemotaxis protein
MKLQQKIFSLLAVGIIVLGLISAIFFVSIASNVTEFEETLASDIEASLEASRMTLQFQTQVQEWKNILLRGYDDKKREKYWGKFQQQHKVVQNTGKNIIKLSSEAIVVDMTKQFLMIHDGLLAKYTNGYKAFITSNYQSTVGDEAVLGINQEPHKLALKITEEAIKKAHEHTDKTLYSAGTTVTAGITTIIIAMIIVLAVGVVAFNRLIVDPIKLTRTYIHKLSKGILDFQVEKYSSSHEISQMFDAIIQLRQNLNQGTDAIQDSIDKLTNCATSLNKMDDTIHERTQQQNQRTDQVATAITEMSAAAQEVAHHASTAASEANQVEQVAQKGVNTMRHAIATIHSTSEQIATTADVVRNLEGDTKSVSTVLDVIKSIAEQTNLLALNATIEAAHAGEYGRGFAVVADEVRTLAQRTQENTAEIHTIIDNVQNGAQNAVMAIEAGQTKTEGSVTQVTEAGDIIENITDSVKQILGTNEQVAQAAKEQSHVANDISKNVDQITNIAEYSSESARQALELSGNLSDISSALINQIKKLKA